MTVTVPKQELFSYGGATSGRWKGPWSAPWGKKMVENFFSKTVMYDWLTTIVNGQVARETSKQRETRFKVMAWRAQWDTHREVTKKLLVHSNTGAAQWDHAFSSYMLYLATRMRSMHLSSGNMVIRGSIGRITGTVSVHNKRRELCSDSSRLSFVSITPTTKRTRSCGRLFSGLGATSMLPRRSYPTGSSRR